MKDSFPSNSASSQARNFEAIVPSDTVPLPRRYKCIYVGMGGTLQLVGDSDPVPVPHVVNAGSTLICSPVFIFATGTDADGLVGWF